MTIYKSNITPGSTYRRVVSLVPSITETIIELGTGDRLVGRTKFCIEPKGEVDGITSVGGTKDFHPDRIEALKPDLIIANKEENDREATLALMDHYPVCVYQVTNLHDAFTMINHLGGLMGCIDEADKMTRAIRGNFKGILQLKQLRPAAYLIWDSPVMVAGGDTFIHHMMTWAGFENVFADKSRYPAITVEELQAIAPFTVLLSSEPFPFREKHLMKYRELLPDTEVKLVDGTYFSWYGSRLARSPGYFSTI